MDKNQDLWHYLATFAPTTRWESPQTYKPESINSREILGYELCQKCGWRNIFWADEGEPQPQLIASLTPGELMCPQCRCDRTQRMACGNVPYDVLFDGETEEFQPLEVTEPGRMTFRQHFRAAARWVMPVSEDTGLWLITLYVLWMGILLFEVATHQWSNAASLLDLAWVLIRLWFGLRAFLIVMHVVLTFALHRGAAGGRWKLAWRETGESPLFPNYVIFRSRRRRRKLEAKYLQDNGFSRRQAKHMVKPW